MIQEYQIRVLPEQAANEQNIKQYLHREKGLDMKSISHIRILNVVLMHVRELYM